VRCHNCGHDLDLTSALAILGRVVTIPVLDWLRHAERTSTYRQEIIMANFEALNAAVAGLGTAIAEAVARIDADFQALKDILANDSADQAAVDAATAQVQASIDALNAIDPDPSNPPSVEPTP